MCVSGWWGRGEEQGKWPTMGLCVWVSGCKRGWGGKRGNWPTVGYDVQASDSYFIISLETAVTVKSKVISTLLRINFLVYEVFTFVCFFF
jgi:hypothetical protein